MRRSVIAVAAAGLVLAVGAPAQFASAGVTRADTAQRHGTVAHSTASFPTLHGFKLPYTDPNQTGLLTLCNEHLQPITHGLITTKPFVWRIVSSVAAPSAYHVKGATATLVTYQPRQYTPAGAWSGLVFGAASVYTNYQHPMVQLTLADQPLDWMTDDFPPIWDHLIELRMYLGGPDMAMDDMAYGAADIQVIGDHWTLVEGGHASCTDGKAESRAQLLGLPGTSGTVAPSNSASTDPAAGSTSSTSPAASGGGSSSSSSNGSATVASTSAENTSSGVEPAAIAVGVLVVVMLGGVALWRGRARRRAGL
jgi:hypothetical protein